jgi:hypothetical protein
LEKSHIWEASSCVFISPFPLSPSGRRSFSSFFDFRDLKKNPTAKTVTTDSEMSNIVFCMILPFVYIVEVCKTPVIRYLESGAGLIEPFFRDVDFGFEESSK